MAEFLRFKGISKREDRPREVIGYGCYTDDSSRQFIIEDEPVPKSFVQVEQIEIVRWDDERSAHGPGSGCAIDMCPKCFEADGAKA